MTPPLPILRLHLTVRADSPLSLPPYAGSMLRGAFGHALLALSPLPHSSGKPCALFDRCAYCQVFAPPALPEHGLQKFTQMPAAFIIEPPQGEMRLAAGQHFGFGMVLVGRALEHLPILMQAWTRALRTGLGAAHSRCTLIHVEDENGHSLPLNETGPMAAFKPSPLPPAPQLGQQASLQLLTPLRLQQQGKPVKSQTLEARTLLITLARRWQLLLDVCLGAQAPQQDFAHLTAAASNIRLKAENLRWFDWGRYSQRQQQEMKLGGLLGQLHLHGDLSPFSELLHLGQWLHVGKNASFGLGGYRLLGNR